MLEVINLACVRGERRLFRDLNFSVSPGELIELRGANGSGKTSLLRIICGLAHPYDGEIRWDGKPIRAWGEEYFQFVAYLAHQNGIKDELTAIENLRISSSLDGYPVTRHDANEFLKQVGLERQRDLQARLLSAGQRRRLALARLLTSRATLWILDEVLTSLDESAVDLFRRFTDEHLRHGGMAIIATHQDLNLLAPRRQQIMIST